MDEIRNGAFTSSKIFLLLKEGRTKGSIGVQAKEYIRKKQMERRMGLPIDTEGNAKPLIWGKLLESRVFDLIGLEYTIMGDVTLQHPTIPYWVGSPDCLKEDTVPEVKCPITRDSFCNLVQPIYDGLSGLDAMNAIRDIHKDGEQYYWQIVSNSVLSERRYGELIVYMPYLSELKAIRELAEGNKNAYWIWASEDDELPYIKDGGYYRNLNKIHFEVPKEDKQRIERAVLDAGVFLNDSPTIIATYDSEVKAIIAEPEFNILNLKKIENDNRISNTNRRP